MRIAHINTLSEGSTGKIMLGIADEARKAGYEVYTYSSKMFRRSKKAVYNEIEGHFYYGTEASNFIHKACGHLFGFNGFFSLFSTLKLVDTLRRNEVDLIHLHNLHEFCINLPILFNYIKKCHVKVVWTLHDCWSFTGHCPHYTLIKCSQWKNGCGHCPQLEIYPPSRLDNTAINWRLKRKLFCGVESMIIATPSQWLADQVKNSYLASYPIKVINNGIDLELFKYRESGFREKHDIVDKKIILGVAFDWGIRKGLDVFVELAQRLDDTYQIVLVGTDPATESSLPPSILSIARTQNQQELAEIYSSANVFVNPTREDNFPTVNIEALACGTPVITFETGGSPEALDESCGIVVPCDDISAMEMAVRHVCEDGMLRRDSCEKRARCFDMNRKFQEYIEIYSDILS